MTETDLRIIHSKLDSLSERLDKLEVQFNLIKGKTTVPNHNKIVEQQVYRGLGEVPCIFDTIREEDRLKPMGISCPCPRCSPYALSSGSFVDAGLEQKWGNEDV